MENNKCEECEHFKQCEIKMIIHNPLTDNNGDMHKIWNNYEINKGDRIGQITLLEHKSYLFGISSEEERDGGFGSTGER